MLKVRDCRSNGTCFNSSFLPPYLKRIKICEELLSWLYLRGIFTDDFYEDLGAFFSVKKQIVFLDYHQKTKTAMACEEHRQAMVAAGFSDTHYVYFLGNAIYTHLRQDARPLLPVHYWPH
ncbi:MAG: hypothetical protein ACTS73_00920 [Arsenophonus sp. NEOnobi-MAG3]